jgi:hypothetical protein
LFLVLDFCFLDFHGPELSFVIDVTPVFWHSVTTGEEEEKKSIVVIYGYCNEASSRGYLKGIWTANELDGFAKKDFGNSDCKHCSCGGL